MGRVDEASLRSPLEEINRAGDKAALLTRQLLAFSRKQMLQPEVLDLDVLLTDVSRMLRRLIGEDIKLVTIFNSGLGQIKADPGQVEQILMNLVANARDAMPQGGELRIETKNEEVDEQNVSQGVAVQPGSYVVLSVRDTGVGMNEEVQKRIFEPFFTTKELGKGTGLGLSTVYGIVKQSDGYIFANSEVGKGTTFRVYFRRIDDAVICEDQAPTVETFLEGSETILLVEDEDMVRNLVRQVLQDRGYMVLDARGGEKAAEMCDQHEGEIHILVTDVVMPQMSGRELAERLHASCPEMKVLFMSGYTDDTVLQHGVVESEVNFIQKPFSPDDLVCKVREVLDA